jgi:hypothetical protein
MCNTVSILIEVFSLDFNYGRIDVSAISVCVCLVTVVWQVLYSVLVAHIWILWNVDVCMYPFFGVSYSNFVLSMFCRRRATGCAHLIPLYLIILAFDEDELWSPLLLNFFHPLLLSSSVEIFPSAPFSSRLSLFIYMELHKQTGKVDYTDKLVVIETFNEAVVVCLSVSTQVRLRSTLCSIWKKVVMYAIPHILCFVITTYWLWFINCYMICICVNSALKVKTVHSKR